MGKSMMNTKRQVLPPGLWIVATPIGNLADVSQRVCWALEEADDLLCEDTRRTSILLSGLQISRSPKGERRLHRLDAHSQLEDLERWVEYLEAGRSLAIVTDAGTPAVSDPGALLVQLAQKAGVKVIPIPGPSAILALLSVSGFCETPFGFRGFFPRKRDEQKRECDQAQASRVSRVFIWFESPKRILSTLQLWCEVFPEVQMVVGKELTKLYERVFSGTAQSVERDVRDEVLREGEIGEWCFAVQFSKLEEETLEEPSSMSANWEKALRCLVEAGVSTSMASRQVSQYFGISKKLTYGAALSLAGKKEEKKS